MNNLGLKFIYQCDICGKEREEYPEYVVNFCNCGGSFDKIGESHNAHGLQDDYDDESLD